MTLDIFKERGTPLERQTFDWRALAGPPMSKLDDDAFTRVRVILTHGLEREACRLQHAAQRMNAELRLPLARIGRVEHHQATMINGLLPGDLSPLETTIGHEQAAIEITAQAAAREPDPYVAQVLRFGLLEDLDHLYRYAAWMDRSEGKDANNILQSYTDIRPGRPTVTAHRAPEDDLRRWYDRGAADPLTKIHSRLVLGVKSLTRDYYLTVGPMFADPVARELYAEIAAIEEQHVTQYEALLDPNETWLEQWLLQEATEVYTYWSCYSQEPNPRLKAIWEQFLSYELEHLRIVRELFERHEQRDPLSVIPAALPAPIRFTSQRAFVREVLANEVDLRALGTDLVPEGREGAASRAYRARMNEQGSPSQIVAAGYRWSPGTELATPMIRDGAAAPLPDAKRSDHHEPTEIAS